MARRALFADRSEAGSRLGERIAALPLGQPLVLALPRGGVPVGAEIARRLGAPLGVALVRKIGAPSQPELAIGAIADGDDPEVVVNARLVRQLGLSEDFVTAEAAREHAAIAARRSGFAGATPPLDAQGRAVIVVDDGVATGMTMRAALRHVRRRGPSRLVAAVPVAARDALEALAAEADEVVCLASPRRFRSVGAFYRSFTQVTDAEVAALLRELGHHGPA
jgi:predicted phosphoribosyltransferase